MPLYRTYIEGQNLQCRFDGEDQYLNFHYSVCLEAACEDSASAQALRCVVDELSAMPVAMEDALDRQAINIGHIEPVDAQESASQEQDFIWYFADDAVFSYKLR